MTVRLKAPWASQAIGTLYSGGDEGYLLGVGKATVETGALVHVNRDGTQTLRAGDAFRLISATNATATTVRVATAFFAEAPLGLLGTIRKDGAGNVSVMADDGTVIASLTALGQVVTLRKVSGSQVAVDGGAQISMPLVVYPTGSAAGGSGGALPLVPSNVITDILFANAYVTDSLFGGDYVTLS